MPVRLLHSTARERHEAVPLVSVLLLPVSLICDTYFLAWNSRKSNPGAHVSLDELYTSIEQNRRPCRRGSKSGARTGDSNALCSLEADILIGSVYCGYLGMQVFGLGPSI